MPECAVTDCPVPEECGGEAACTMAALPHAAGPDCDVWVDEKCHAACAPDPVREWQGDEEHGAWVWMDDGESCGPDCPRLEEIEDDYDDDYDEGDHFSETGPERG